MACEIQPAIGAVGCGFDMNVARSSATIGSEQTPNRFRPVVALPREPSGRVQRLEPAAG